MGILFPRDQEAAYSAFRIWMSLGFAIGFAITELKRIDGRIWAMLAVLIFSFALYTLLEFLLKYGGRYCGLQMGETHFKGGGQMMDDVDIVAMKDQLTPMLEGVSNPMTPVMLALDENARRPTMPTIVENENAQAS